MKYKTLSNKWRPKNLKDVIGQDEAIYIIKNIIKSKSIHNSFLIHGYQGTGKTTIARIIIKCLNCKINITLNPCNKCICCRKIEKQISQDSIEIDAASNTRIEDIKEIIKSSKYKNKENRFKTYIIDEAHMLSINSFNFLLKIIEENKENSIYIFVTTKLEKIPETIISRCINLKLKRISMNNIKKCLKKILNDEKIKYENNCLEKISIFSNGSIRQAINIIEKINKSKIIKLIHINKILGLLNEDKILILLKNIIENNIKNLIKISKNLINNNINLENTLYQIQWIVYKILLFKNSIIYDKNILNNPIFIYLSNKINKKKIEIIYYLILEEKIILKKSFAIEMDFEIFIINIANKINS